MRKVKMGINEVKLRISQLKGRPVKLLVNRGRKKIVKIIGEIIEIYPSLFTVKVEGSKTAEILSYSFSDVLCGDVAVHLLQERTQEQSAEIKL